MPYTRDGTHFPASSPIFNTRVMYMWSTIVDPSRQSIHASNRVLPTTAAAPVLPEVVLPPQEEVTVIADACRCEYCKHKKGEKSKLRNGVVHGYNGRPRGGWKPREVVNDPHNFYLGVELETDNFFLKAGPQQVPNYSNQYRGGPARVTSDADGKLAAGMRLPKTLWYPKRDGSVTGPEFASHPATLSYWQSKEKDLSEMFQTLLHAGYRSHDNDKCGMHINISRTAFGTPDHLYKFITLINFSPAWSTRMSQRTKDSVDHWAPLKLGNNKAERRRISSEAFRSNWDVTDKYAAINIPQKSQGRIEFRLPRGTLRLDRFFKNLEWTTAMVEYTKSCSVAKARPTDFTNWLMENRGKFANCAAFMIEREPKLTAALG